MACFVLLELWERENISGKGAKEGEKRKGGKGEKGKRGKGEKGKRGKGEKGITPLVRRPKVRSFLNA